MDYAAAVAALQARGRFGISLGLERIERLLAELGDPGTGLAGSLVGGTNGKGSVVALTRSVLNAARLRVGTMPKPHLVSYRERIAVDGVPLRPQQFADAVAEVLPVADRISARLGPPTEFETLTAAAVLALSRMPLDLMLVEVGMGGRLDATNALDLGVATIVNVQHDHERYLGRTLRAIGTEKAAIIKRGDLAVTGASGTGLRPIVERAAEVAAPLRCGGKGREYDVAICELDWDGMVVSARRPDGDLADLRIGLLGSHQAQNVAVALALLDALAEDAQRRGRRADIDEAALRAGLAGARWPGRMDLLPGPPGGPARVLLDGAHNPAGAAALARSLAELGVRAPVLVFGAMRGKHVTAVLRHLARLHPRPIFTRVADAHAHDPAALRARWRAIVGTPAELAPDPARALEAAARIVADDQPVVVAGSLYLVGAVRALLTGDREEGS